MIEMPNPFLVEKMTMAPNQCLCCGKGNTPDGQTGEVGPFVDLAIDYNWGDSAYLCPDCVGRCAVLMGWISPDTEKTYKQTIKGLHAKIHDLEATIDLKRKRERQALRKVRA
jgi:hypothetical protein